jgi:hypothetical protein
MNNFINNYFSPLTGIPRFSVGDPLNVTLGLSVVAIFLWFLIKRRFFFVLILSIIVVFSTIRSNPGEIRETDYQSIMYILVASAGGLFTLFQLKKELDNGKQIASYKIVTGIIFSTLALYWLFTSYFLTMKFWQKVYPKYMGTQALIYDRPEITPILNQLVGKDDYAWVGPFDFKELFYLKAKTPSKYHWFLDHAGNIDKIKTEMMADFWKNRPKVIVFRRYFHPWGGKASEFNYFFTNFLDREYFRISEYNQTLSDREYKWKIGNTQNYDIDGDFYFDKQKQSAIIDSLLSLNFIEMVPKAKQL